MTGPKPKPDKLTASEDDVIGVLVTDTAPPTPATEEAKVLKAEAESKSHTSQAQADIEADKRRTAGQRTINYTWEVTQASIALMVTGTAMYVAARLAIDSNGSEDTQGKALAIAAFQLVSNLVFLVIGAYFSRTNHQKMGGVGEKIEGETR